MPAAARSLEAGSSLMSHDKISLEGQIEGVIFHNDENGYTVFSISPEAGDDEIVCTGFLSNPLEGENIKIEGTYVDNPKYGRQFSVTNAHRIPPSTLAGIEKYLASGIIKGIGAKTAKQIVARFGEKSFEVIESDPDKLSQIRGISLLKAVMMSEAFHAQHAQREAMLFLQENGITPAAAMKIYKRYKDETIESVRQNPYRLADDIDGIGFKTADAIAYRMGISRDAPARISAGVRYVLWEAANDGHTYMPTSALTRQAADLLICPPEIVENELARMQMERHIIREKLADANEPYVFVSALYYAEMKIAKKLFSLNLSRPDHPVGASFAREDSPREGDFNNGRLAELHPASRECAEADTCLRRQNPSPRTP
ncbi:MAG: helix-hairpin-helix domain-containing protein, partial [Defluviitaleaceae bacterium]|nr:helix-hairpin-helix domain-containing protein [Defluviitaleaceae bacterium]